MALMRRELAVEEDGNAGLGSDSARGREGLLPGGLVVVLVEPDNRADVEGADARMSAVLLRHIDGVDACPSAVHQRRRERAGWPAQGENRAVVNRVRVGIEERRAGCERGRDGVDPPLVAPLGEVGDREEHAPIVP